MVKGIATNLQTWSNIVCFSNYFSYIFEIFLSDSPKSLEGSQTRNSTSEPSWARRVAGNAATAGPSWKVAPLRQQTSFTRSGMIWSSMIHPSSLIFISISSPKYSFTRISYYHVICMISITKILPSPQPSLLWIHILGDSWTSSKAAANFRWDAVALGAVPWSSAWPVKISTYHRWP